MRIASFNVENLFSRPRAMNLGDFSEGKPILDEYGKFNKRIQKPVYTAADKAALIDSLKKLGLAKSDESKFVRLRQNRGKLVKRGSGGLQIVAEGREDWVGWLELRTEAVDETATAMTAKVIDEVNADVLCVVEAEDRIALCRFSDQLLKPLNVQYSSIMLIDGNDERGIDVGIMVKNGFAVESMISHVDDFDGDGRVFSRDCPEYLVRNGAGPGVLILVNHLKSKGFGAAADSNAKRRRQAQRVREIYNQRRSEGVDHIAIVGDFNDTPDSDPLEPLLANGSDLKDITEHPNFQSDGRPGTFKNGTASNKIDYVLLSPALFNKVTAGQIFRRGVWGGVNGTLFPHFDEMTKEVHAASDHAAIWAEVDL